MALNITSSSGAPIPVNRSHVSRISNFFFRVIFTFLLRYRRTVLGPLWTLVGPIVFVATLGFLYAHIGDRDPRHFIPSIAVGFPTWLLMQHLITDGASVYRRGRANILQGELPLDDLVMLEVMTNVVTFMHQCLVIVGVFVIYQVSVTFYALTSLVGLAFIVLNGVWVMRLFGLLGARYRDLTEVLPAVMRIAFLATPILWTVDKTARGSLLGPVVAFNPFYHFLELVRAPLLGEPLEPLSWLVVISITLAGFLVEGIISARYARFVALWV